MGFHLIRLDTFNRDIVVLNNVTDSYLRDKLSGCFTHEERDILCEPGFSARALIGESNVVCIRFRKKLPTPGEIAHEVLHAIRFILNGIDTPFNSDTEEIHAYMLHYITDQIYNKYYVRK